MKEKIKTCIIKITWLPSFYPHGYANGYVGVPKGHPWFGKDYDDLMDIEIHGGLTFSDSGTSKCNFIDDLWYVGFDTCHYGDDLNSWPRERVEMETEKLRQFAIDACV